MTVTDTTGTRYGPCTPAWATCCPVHGDCTCTLTDPLLPTAVDCPLHGMGTAHPLSIGVLRPGTAEPPARFRTGRKVGRTVYLQVGDGPDDTDVLVGMMDTPELAAFAARAMNLLAAGSVPAAP